nr:unnamed protein product [Digitaria exilis]
MVLATPPEHMQALPARAQDLFYRII